MDQADGRKAENGQTIRFATKLVVASTTIILIYINFFPQNDRSLFRARVSRVNDPIQNQPALPTHSKAFSTVYSSSFVPPLCSFQYQVVDDNCPRFSYAYINRYAGLGHKFGDFILSILYALETGSTHVVDLSNFYNTGVHGDYEWVESFFRLGLNEQELHTVMAEI